MQPLSGNHRPDLLTSLMHKHASLQILFKHPTHACHLFCNCHKTLACCLLLDWCRIHHACHRKRCWCEHVVVFLEVSIFTSKCASPDNGVHFFDISTSKSGLNVWCFSAFDLMLRHNGKNVENCGLGGVHFWRSGDTFSASQFPKVLRH